MFMVASAGRTQCKMGHWLRFDMAFAVVLIQVYSASDLLKCLQIAFICLYVFT